MIVGDIYEVAEIQELKIQKLEKGIKEAIDHLNDATYSLNRGCLVEGKNAGSHVELARNTLRNINL